MANYETAAGIGNIFSDAAAAGGVSTATANAISALVADLTATGADVAVANPVGDVTEANVAQITAPIVMTAPGANVNAVFDAASPVKAIVLNDATQASDITFATNENVTVQLGGATGDQVVTGGGSDSISFAGGSATVDTGAGTDTVAIRGDGEVHVQQSGSGDLTVELATDGAAATIDAGDGFDRLTLDDDRANHSFTVDPESGRFVMSSENPVTMDGVNVVTFTDADNVVQNITILASTEGQALVGRLYQVGLGREAMDNGTVDGLKFWLEDYENGLAGNANANAAQINQIGQAILSCPEFAEKYGNLSDTDFVSTIMGNIGQGVTTVNGMTAAEYAAQLEGGLVSRADIAITFAMSQEAQTAMGLASEGGNQYVIEGWA